MLVVFYTSLRRQDTAEAFAHGVRRHGDAIILQPLGSDFMSDPHIAVIVGNKQKHFLDPLAARGCPIITLDRAYATLNADGELSKADGYARISINGSHPLSLLTTLQCPSDRCSRFGWAPKPWRKRGQCVVVAGSAKSYYDRVGVKDIRYHLSQLVMEVKAHTQLPVLFRVKPNLWKTLGAVQSDGDASHRVISLHALLSKCHTVVVEESSIVVEALLYGVPSVVLGPSPTRTFASHNLAEVDSPKLASADTIKRFFNDLAYFQYHTDEYYDGTAWDFVRRLL